MTPSAIRYWLRGTVRYALDYPDVAVHWWMVGYVYRQLWDATQLDEPCAVPGCVGVMRAVRLTERDSRRGATRKRRCSRCGYTITHLGALPTAEQASKGAA